MNDGDVIQAGGRERLSSVAVTSEAHIVGASSALSRLAPASP